MPRSVTKVIIVYVGVMNAGHTYQVSSTCSILVLKQRVVSLKQKRHNIKLQIQDQSFAIKLHI